MGVRSGSGRDGGLALENDDPVGKVCSHDEVMLDDERRLLRMKNKSAKASIYHYVSSKMLPVPLNDLAGDDTLLRV
jgi:hypothetical protein